MVSSSTTLSELTTPLPNVQAFSIKPGSLKIHINSCFLNVSVKRPYVIITIGDQIHQTSISDYPQGQWNEGFEFLVSYHAQLFDTIQLDLYDSYMLLPDRHVGRAEIRLRKLEGMPEEFTSYYEIWEKKLSKGASSLASQKKTTESNVGAIQVRISYVYQSQDPVTPSGKTKNPSLHSKQLYNENELEEEFLRLIKAHRERPPGEILFRKYEETSQRSSFDEEIDKEEEEMKRSTLVEKRPSDLEEQHMGSYRIVEQDRAKSIPKKEEEEEIPATTTTTTTTTGSVLGTVSAWLGFTQPVPSQSKSTTSTSTQDTLTEPEDPSNEEHTDLIDTMNTLTTEDDSLKTFPILDAIGSWTVNKETNQVLRAIGKLLAAFGQGFELSNIQILTGFTMLEKFYTQLPRDRTWDLVEDLSEIELASHFWDYSLASYGWKGVNLMGKGNGYISDAVRDHSDALTVMEYLKLPEECLLAYELRTGEAFRPSYFVAQDPSTDSLVLCIRGTMSAFDTMTDLVCEYEPWKGGFVHKGMKSAAAWLFRHVAPQLVTYANENSVSALHIVGHSLGAATAAILTIMLLDHIDEFPKDKEGNPFVIRCFGYAPACGLSIDLSERYKDYIQSIVFADDFVSKLSYGSMMDVKELIIGGAEAAQNLGIGQLLWTQEPEGEQWKKAFDQIEECRRRCLESMDNPRLYVAGMVYQFWLDPVPGKDTRIVVERTDPRRVSSELIIRRSILLDHLPSNFDVSFRRAREALMANKDDQPVGVLDPSHSEDTGDIDPRVQRSSSTNTVPLHNKCSMDTVRDTLAEEGLKRTTERGGGDAHAVKDAVR
ncbi:hypothetical protein J3Q64DRAFT_1819449 [Phycomyces blakesleeanus]|uniref:sn-1-specific diacylglycerol lipase n=2 Tax=Phycomyces blakesleeanus TaxID=4837 RepID=A0A167R2L1_PHYB8|nr:hypothetical protein PHYBLDRAFT_184419 [Phycomyces blakesleeanus NRRL 1555(-)]OAD80699.1 hypothetical protein PHYBLDRAFT_184419 [Phycomyces blakesleeanus NRRL 1555(-)]|eukprot:XP_018298739.1 hypothetical protein PHYBLDRAFT_184419 [Phycomyces blakesleeanus NRRL 1555(-)]